MDKRRMHVCLVCHTEPDVWDGGFKSIDIILPMFMDILEEIRDIRGVSPKVAWCMTAQVAQQRPGPFHRLFERGHEIGVHSHYPAENGLLEHRQDFNRDNLDSFKTWLPELCEIITQAGFPAPKAHVTWMFAYREAVTLALAASNVDIDCSVCYGGAHYLDNGFLLADSREGVSGKPYKLDMVAKGMSWALRDLSKRDRQAVEQFLEEHEKVLPALVKREVRNRLVTGRKNPRRTSSGKNP